MLLSKRDQRLIGNIIEDADTLALRIEHFHVTREQFLNDLTFEGDIVYDSLMAPVYTLVEDAIHLSDDVMGALPNCPWDAIRGFRNIVAHGYRTVNRDIAWEIITEHIPQLVNSVKTLDDD